MYFFGVQTPVAHQFSGEQQHRNFVAVAHFRGGVGIDVEHIDAGLSGRRQLGKLRQHLLAQAAPWARVQQETHRQRRGSSGPTTDLTEWAMNSTVCAGTSPTAVT
jgi:hypothetical protein